MVPHTHVGLEQGYTTWYRLRINEPGHPQRVLGLNTCTAEAAEGLLHQVDVMSADEHFVSVAAVGREIFAWEVW